MTKDIPPRVAYGGIPAKYIRDRKGGLSYTVNCSTFLEYRFSIMAFGESLCGLFL